MRGTGVWQFVILLVLPQGLFIDYEPHYLKVTFFFFLLGYSRIAGLLETSAL